MTPAEKNPKVISTLVLVFLAGAVVGALGMRLGLHEALHPAIGGQGAPFDAAASAQRRVPRGSHSAVLQRFKTELDLSGTQTEQIAAVLDDYRRYYQNIQDELNDVRATGKSRIMEILQPQQREKFEKIMSELQPQLETK